MSELSDRDQEDLGNTAEDIEKALQYRDEIIGSGQGDTSNKSRIALPFAPPTLDGAALLFSRYGLQDSGLFRMYDLVSAPASDESDLAKLSRTFQAIPLYSSFISCATAACLTLPGIFNEFTRSNQLTIWRTKEMAKRQAFDHCMFTASKLAVGVAIKSYFLTAGFLYVPLVISAYRGKSTQWDHAISSSATLGLFCLPRGLRPCLIGSGIGLCVGLMYGYPYYLGAQKWGYRYEDMQRRRSLNIKPT